MMPEADSKNSDTRVDLTLLIPVYNEESNLQQLYDELNAVLKQLHRTYEILFILDGCTDRSEQIIDEIKQKDAHIKKIVFGRNYGQTAAMQAGFDHSNGEIIIAMDADLQNDPADIIVILRKMEEGYDVVSGWRKNRQDPFFSRILPSKIANWLISKTVGLKLKDYGCTLKAYRRDIIKDLKIYGEMHRFIPALTWWLGAKIAEVEVNHRPRVHGKSKYGISRTIRVVLDLMTVKFLLSYSTRPIQLFGSIGLLLTGGGGLILAYLVILRILRLAPLANRPLLILSGFAVMIGILLISLGILGELMVRIYHESQGKPIYRIKNKD
jgi:glycosyltransferase involved in cell wall biosynthesis